MGALKVVTIACLTLVAGTVILEQTGTGSGDPNGAHVAPANAEHSTRTAKAESAPHKPTTKAIDDYAIVRQAAAMSAKGDGVAILLNLQGELCAEVLSAQPHKTADTFMITCIENRSGASEARYVFNAKNGEARRL